MKTIDRGTALLLQGTLLDAAQKPTYEKRINHLEAYGWSYNDKHYRWDYLIGDDVVAWITVEALFYGV